MKEPPGGELGSNLGRFRFQIITRRQFRQCLPALELNVRVINVPNYPGTVCWLSGQYASVTGDTNNVPVPATPIASNSSEPPSGTPEAWSHNPSEWAVMLRWVSTDPDQTAVRVYRNNRHIATLGAHASVYTDVFLHNWHWDVTYGVQAVNSSEVSSIVTVEVDHCG